MGRFLVGRRTNKPSAKKREVFLAFGKKVKIRVRIIGLFLLIVTAAITLAAGVTYSMGKSNLETMTKNQLNNSVRAVIDQVSLLSGAYNSKQFSDKLGYVLTAEQASFVEAGLDAKIYLVDSSGFEVNRSNVNAESSEKSDLPQEFISQALKKQKGNQYLDFRKRQYCISFGYLLEKDWIYAVAVSKDSYLQPVYKLQKAVVASGIVSLLMALLLSFLGTRGMIKTIINVNRAVAKADEGDLTVRAKVGGGGPELEGLANDFNIMISSFQEVLKEISDTIEDLNISGKQLTHVAEQTDEGFEHIHTITFTLAEGTENQKQHIRDIKESVDRIMETILHITDLVNGTTQKSGEMIGVAEEGMKSIRELESKMADIEEVSSNTVIQIKMLEDRSQVISAIANSIKSISQQTRLLSLNASIEAARAGEFGRGFAVVAEEIQKLAQSSAQSAFEVEKITQEINNDTRLVSEIAVRAKGISHEGAQLVNKTTDTFHSILNKVTETHEHIALISENSSTIKNNTEVFIGTLQEVTQILLETAAGSQEVAAEVENHKHLSSQVNTTAFQLLESATRLDHLKNRFKTSS